jgi:RNA-directed DNA polymerase
VVENGGSAGVDRQSVRELEKQRDKEIASLQKELRDRSYGPQPVKRVWIEKLGSKEKRPLGIPAARDRVVQGALRHVMEPIFERDFAPHSYGFRPGKGCKDALRRVEQLLKGGCRWVVDADLKSYFDTIPQERLLQRIGEKIADGRVLELIEAMLGAGVMENHKGWEPTESGTPQGSVISPLLSNIYLDPLDWLMAQGGYEMVRYADDFIILCTSETQAQEALERVKEWVSKEGLKLHPEKTRIVDASQRGGFDFLGYHFERGMKWPRKKSQARLKETIRRKTHRNRAGSMRTVCEELNRTLRGWYEYYKHSKVTALEAVDGYVRGRLRSILRRRHRREGKGHGRDHQKWPNAYFNAMGLFSLVGARMAACQSL